jgi:putative SOS response-associated peptidase YedK
LVIRGVIGRPVEGADDGGDRQKDGGEAQQDAASPQERDGRTIKQPYYIHPHRHDGTLALAGLYEIWHDKTKDQDDPDAWIWSAVIITTEATEATGAAGDIHDRTPVILPRDRWAAWLDPDRTEPADVAKVLAGIQIDGLSIREISTDVNRVANNGPHLIHPVPDHGDHRLDLTMTVAA